MVSTLVSVTRRIIMAAMTPLQTPEFHTQINLTYGWPIWQCLSSNLTSEQNDSSDTTLTPNCLFLWWQWNLDKYQPPRRSSLDTTVVFCEEFSLLELRWGEWWKWPAMFSITFHFLLTLFSLTWWTILEFWNGRLLGGASGAGEKWWCGKVYPEYIPNTIIWALAEFLSPAIWELFSLSEQGYY